MVLTRSKLRKQKAEVAPVAYQSGKIPYGVSEPNRFWKIKKGLDGEQYWKKRYWRRRITGKGGYFGEGGRAVGESIGGFLGNLGGGIVGDFLGRITGLGTYKVNKNVFMDGRLPEVKNDPEGGGTVIRFQEYLCDVVTSATANTFNYQDFLINAANPLTFPYLSQIAANYEQYEVQGLLFQFRSTSADALNSTNTALGSVMMATQYDVLDSPFLSKLAMLNYEYSTSVKPSESALHMIECDPRQSSVSTLYTLYNESVPDNADPRLYHLGRFYIATTGFQGTSVNIGELHVTYQVKLMKPKLYASLGNLNTLVDNVRGSISSTNPLGLTSTTLTSNNSQVELSGDSILLPISSARLNWLISMRWYAADGSMAWTTFPTITPTNCVLGLNQLSPTSAYGAMNRVTVLADGNYLRPQLDFTGASLTGGTSTCEIIVLSIANNLEL